MNLMHHDKKQLDESAAEGKGNIEGKELIKCLLRLKYQENLLERDMQAFLNVAKIDPYVIQHPRNIAETHSKRSDDFKELKKNLGTISHDLKSVKSMLDDIGRLDVNTYKKMLTKLAHKIHSCKESLKPETLFDEQVRLESQVNTILVKYHIT